MTRRRSKERGIGGQPGERATAWPGLDTAWPGLSLTWQGPPEGGRKARPYTVVVRAGRGGRVTRGSGTRRAGAVHGVCGAIPDVAGTAGGRAPFDRLRAGKARPYMAIGEEPRGGRLNSRRYPAVLAPSAATPKAFWRARNLRYRTGAEGGG